MIIKCIDDFLPDGSTKPFTAITDAGERVVVKGLVKPTSGKLLLNEFIAGSLANRIELPWPHTRLGILSGEAIAWLESKGIHVFSPHSVSTSFIEGLISVPWPTLQREVEGKLISTSLEKANLDHLRRYFDNPEAQSAFYGKALFELWLFFQDTKYDTLFSLPDRRPLFLDGSHAFEGSEWDKEALDYEKEKCLPQSPYLKGILLDRGQFSIWLDRIESVEAEYIQSLLESIPTSWGIKRESLNFLYELLTSKRKVFLATWRHRLLELNWEGEW